MDIIVVVCEECGHQALPPIYTCPKCTSNDFVEMKHTGTGSIYSYTTIRVAAGKYEPQLPYIVALVELEGGLRVTARLEGEQASIGQYVKMNRVEESIYWFE
ncbi:OB-fold domain-containing protein [Bacillus sp. ISL-18]|uniref:Zn-ribbon domain-containing OB-fold protein n=1 Tax=Bacillus sp. ISL-18 TaxID=2819118 RepID=UPI001BE52D2D|nr:OB-fold domain-containing protein [Bacillus sp. ISL-18]MBT2655106.1 OB-fold domain-containing protein [Bacillus sp. ISL-18]